MPPGLISCVRAQSFALVLDTGSSDLWFATTGCSSCNADTPLLDSTKSSSFQSTGQNIPLSYGSGNATGSLAHDTVSVGQFTVAQQTFGEQFTHPTALCFACVGRLVTGHNTRFVPPGSKCQGDLVRWLLMIVVLVPNAKAYPSQPSSSRIQPTGTVSWLLGFSVVCSWPSHPFAISCPSNYHLYSSVGDN